MGESAIDRASVHWLREQGAVCIKLSTLQRYGTSGYPDRLVLWEPARVWFIEFKAPGKQPTLRQWQRIRALRALGFDVDVLDSTESVRKRWKELNA